MARRARGQARRRALKRHAPTLSVVVPAYNVEAYVGECLESLLGSTLQDLEVIVVDDGSTDGTREVARRIALRDGRVTVLHQTNSGQGIARNVGVDHARGEFLAFIDADDTVPPRAFAHMVNTLRTTGSDFVVGSARRFSNDTYRLTAWAHTVHQKDRFGVTIESFPLAMQDIIACNRMFRTAFWREKVGGFRGHIAYEDHVPMLTAYVRASGFDILSGTTYNWRIREDLTSTSQQKRSLENLLDRIAVKEEAHELLRAEAPAAVYDTWVARALEVDFGPFVDHALASGEMYRNILSAAYKTFLSRAGDEAMSQVRYIQKTRAWLTASERWDDLDRAEAYFREFRMLPPTVVEDGRLLAEPVDFLAGAPESIRELSPVETRFDGSVFRSEWRPDGSLELTGWALVRGLDMREPGGTTAWWTCHETGERVDADLEPLDLPEATTWANNLNMNYDGSGFRIVVDPATLVPAEADAATWVLHLAVEHRGVRREGTLHRVVKGGSAESPITQVLDKGGEPVVVEPTLDKQRGFGVAVRRAGVRLVDVTPGSGRSVRGTVVAPGRRPTEVTAGAPGQAPARAAVTTSADRHTFDLRLPGDGPWDLGVVLDDGSTEPVTWALAAPDRATAAPGLRWERTLAGGCSVHRADDRLVVTAISADDTELRLRVLSLPGDTQRLRAARFGNDRVSLTPREVVPDGETTELVFPLVASMLGGAELPLPSGVYRFTVPAAGGTPELRAFAGIETHGATPVWLRPETFHLRVTAATSDGELHFGVLAPFTEQERALSGQKELQLAYQAATPEPEPAVLFGCYRGEFATDSQKALDVALREARPDLTRYWGVADRSVEVPEGSVPVLMGSRQWYDVLASATYLCNNIDFDGYFRKRPHQTYLQTFHGYPFKSMGRTFWLGKGYSEERIARECDRRNREYDAILVPSEECAGYYRQEYDYTGEILVTGYPRSDFLVNADRSAVRTEVLKRLGVPEGRTTVLYAPTYRDNLTTRTYAAKLFVELDLERLTRRLGNDVVILLRGHNNNQREAERITALRNVVDVTDYPDINELTVAADAAILDYSSLRFEWALTGKPAVFFVPDIDSYFAKRPPLFGFTESAPGPLLSTTDEVAEELADLPGLAARTRERIAAFNATYNGLHDGHATERVLERFFDVGATPGRD